MTVNGDIHYSVRKKLLLNIYEFSKLYDEKGLKRIYDGEILFEKKSVHQQSTLSSCLKYECWNIAC